MINIRVEGRDMIVVEHSYFDLVLSHSVGKHFLLKLGILIIHDVLNLSRLALLGPVAFTVHEVLKVHLELLPLLLHLLKGAAELVRCKLNF